MSAAIDKLKAMFAELGPDIAMDLDGVYTEDMTFEDPFHKVEGRENLRAYFGRMNSNIKTCTFDFIDTVHQGDQAFLTWKMTLVTKRGPRGPVVVLGATHVKIEGEQISYHRDYFDAAELVYEHVPLVGSAIRAIRKRM